MLTGPSEDLEQLNDPVGHQIVVIHHCQCGLLNYDFIGQSRIARRSERA